MYILKFAFLVAVLLHTAKAAFGPKRLYSMDIPTTPSSVKVVGKDLIITGPWYIGAVTNVKWKFRQPGRMTPRIINKDIADPRSVGKIPSNAFSGSRALTYWVATWGSNGTSGAMYVMRPTTTYSVWKDISIDAGWNYERAQWLDMNRDGRIDCLTARIRGGVGQLLWFQQPAGQDKWGQQIIHEGMADGNFIGFAKGGKSYILVAGLQFSTLGLYWTLSKRNLWSSSRMVRHRVVDNYGKFYDVQYVDLNKDGRPDVLTTTVNIGNSRGHVLGYEVPNDIQNKIWNRRVLAAGFQGDYSPGKATAFWPNKWKRKADRPSVFLSGAGQELLFILTPKPARSGWSYVRSSLRAGTGMIGIPYIGDLDGDSYPEVIVPQGKKLVVFSYDYNAAVAAPPNTPPPGALVTPRPLPNFAPPFFRPPAAPLSPRDASPDGLAPNSGGLSGNDASQFGASGILPSGRVSTQTVAPLGNLPPIRTRGGGTSNSGGAPRNTASNLPGNVPRYQTSNQGSSASSQGTGAADNSAGGSSSTNNGRLNAGVSLWPVMTNNGPVFIPVPNQANAPSAPNTGNSPAVPPRSPGGSSAANSQRSWNAAVNNRITSQGGSSSAGNNAIVPLGGDSSSNSRITSQGGSSSAGNNAIVPLGGGSSSNNRIVPLGGANEPVYPANEEQNRVPFGGESNSGQTNSRTSSNIVPLGGSNTPSRGPMEPIFEDETEPPEYDDHYTDEDYYDSIDQVAFEPPPNLLLSITSQSYQYRVEAADACSFENKVLCNLMQLEAAKSTGPIPLIEWGWFDAEGRAASIHDCVPGEVKWRGYKCHNGVIGHAPVQQSTALKGFCCAVLRGANVTDRKFSNYLSAEEGCGLLGSHICSLDEMHKVWKMSSYKSDVWGWYRDDQKLIKMVHNCNPNQVLWPGYECLSRRLATSKISATYVQESAYCCHDSSASATEMQFILFLFSLLVSSFIIF